MTRYLQPAVITAILLASTAAQAAEGDWYVAPSVAYTDDDPDRKIDDDFSGGQVQVGREMSRRFSLEGLLGYHDIDGFPGQEHLELGVNAVGNFLPDSRFSPYVIGGLGYLRADVGDTDFGGLPPAGSTASSATATAGLGLRIRFGESRWALRTEWRARHAFDDSLTDQVASIGVQYSFGGAAAPAAAVFAAEPVAEPVPAVVVVGDTDRDGVTDDKDRCPGTWGADVYDDGCERIRLKNVYFDIESAVLTAHARAKLDETVTILKQNPGIEVEIAGHADSTGPEEFNMALSVRRAEAVRSYLEAAGIGAARLSARGYGESQPMDSNDTMIGRFDNRRVELHALGR